MSKKISIHDIKSIKKKAKLLKKSHNEMSLMQYQNKVAIEEYKVRSFHEAHELSKSNKDSSISYCPYCGFNYKEVLNSLINPDVKGYLGSFPFHDIEWRSYLPDDIRFNESDLISLSSKSEMLIKNKMESVHRKFHNRFEREQSFFKKENNESDCSMYIPRMFTNVTYERHFDFVLYLQSSHYWELDFKSIESYRECSNVKGHNDRILNKIVIKSSHINDSIEIAFDGHAGNNEYELIVNQLTRYNLPKTNM